MTQHIPTAAGQPARTALFDEHAKLGAAFTDFGGWDMPLKYGSELAEHRAVREAAGLFDLSHMGEIWVDGPDAVSFLNTALVGDVRALALGRAKYSLICAADGGIIDDLICYRLADQRYLVVPNAGNAATVFAALAERAAGFDVRVTDATAETSLIAVQGPAALAVMQQWIAERAGADSARGADAAERIAALRYYACVEVVIGGVEVLVARTGYTGEDGFELFLANAAAAQVWQELLVAGEAFDMISAGLAARDSLRLEAGMPLYGNELSREVNPLEAGLGGVVSFKKPEDFIGRGALAAAQEAGPTRVLVGLRGAGRRAARAGYPVVVDGDVVGAVTSGLPSPTLGYPVALAYVARDFAVQGNELSVDLRGKLEPFTVVSTPFYTRAS